MATALRLYDTVDALVAVRAWLDEPDHIERLIQSGGDLDALPELRDLLDQAELDFKTKAERVALVAIEKKRTAEAIGREIERLTALRKAAENSERGIKAYLLYNFTRANTKRVDGTLAKVRVQANPPAVKSTLTPEAIHALHAKGCAFTVEVIPDPLYTLPAAGVLAAYKDAIEEVGEPPELGEADYDAKLETWRGMIAVGLRAVGVPEGVSVERGAHVRIA
jgi:hypothetical protein